jgi:hypothetical protein
MLRYPRHFGRISAAKTALFSAAALAVVMASPAQAAGTLAGTSIVNTAQATYDDGGTTVTVDSNPVALIVDEILDIAVTSTDPGDVTAGPGEADAVLTFTVTNGGNGPEAVVLTIDPNMAGDDFDPDAVTLYIDANGNGIYDAGVDTLYNASSPPVLNPDETIAVFILGDMPAAADGERSEVELTGTAATGSGAPGTVFAGQGEGGGDAVVGSTGATSADSGFYVIFDADLDLTKGATVLADGRGYRLQHAQQCRDH